jgi:hypothetical protein
MSEGYEDRPCTERGHDHLDITRISDDRRRWLCAQTNREWTGDPVTQNSLASRHQWLKNPAQ